MSKVFFPSLLCLTVFASFVFLSCNSSVDSVGDENFSIATEKSTVFLTNHSDQVVHYILLEYKTSTLVDLAPDTEWSTLEANSKVSIPYSEIMGYQESSKKAFIMWVRETQSSTNSLEFKL